jgi:Protein of unknown function (DUF3095)
MSDMASDDHFLDTLPIFTDFRGVTDPANYRALPDGWELAVADIVNSTKAIEAGRYKMVNMAGASVISALLNALARKDLPFVFSGDGALVAFPSTAMDAAREALAALQAWAAAELGLTMRAAIVPVADIRAKGLDVRVARFQASDEVSYAMFAGGGSTWAEAEMKAGRYKVDPASPGTRPDLSGLSCRWNPIAARHGEIVSIIAVPNDIERIQAFQDLVSDVIALASEQERDGHPMPAQGPEQSLLPAALDVEARAVALRGLRLLFKLSVLAQFVVGWIADRLDWRIGPFDIKQYKRDVASNSDFRKFDDGLKMTVDISEPILHKIEERLAEAERAGICRYGIHRQSSALMTCLVASPLQRDHVHFVDGAAGGYAMAAASLKVKLAA